MKIASPRRGLSKMHEDIKRQREERERNQQRIVDTYYKKPSLSITKHKHIEEPQQTYIPQPVQQPTPNVHNIYNNIPTQQTPQYQPPIQQTQPQYVYPVKREKISFFRLATSMVLAGIICVAAYWLIVNPEGFIDKLSMVFDRLISIVR